MIENRLRRALRRPVFWSTGMTLADVLLLSVLGAVVVPVLILLVLVAVSRVSP